MLTEPHFKDNNSRIVDECLTFFFAGSQTSAAATQNLICSLVKHPEYQQQLRDELEEKIILPHLSKFKPGQKFDNLDILELITFENASELELFITCFNESLRMQPPVWLSSSCSMSETVQCGKLLLHKDNPFSISIWHLHNNPDEWIQPEKFIPERFDVGSPFYLTPKGTKRNPFSFSPFLGGSRICMGKTFIEAVSRLTTPVLLANFDFELPDGVEPDKFKYPHNNMSCQGVPDITMRITDRHPVYTSQEVVM